MQSLNAYFYPNAVDVQLNINPLIIQRYRMPYKRTLKLYKGIDNVVRFSFKNADQKPVNITGWSVKFNMINDDEGSIIVTKDVTVVDANTGIVTATLSELDLMDLNNEFYNYSLSVTDPNGSEQVIYTDDNYNARGEIQLLAGHYPLFKPSIQVALTTDSMTNMTTSSVTADTPTRQQSSHHTAQFYFDNFTGRIDIQATLDTLPPNGSTGGNTSLSWGTVASIQYIDQVLPDYCNFEGVYTAVRFRIVPFNTTSGNISKILYRA